ncbi:hypothetical protein PO909_015514 [Leuciscus waleckii]
MKNFVVIFMVLAIMADKLRLINGGLVTGGNGVNPQLVGGLNPPMFSGGAAVIGQPPFTQFLPGAALSPYVLQQPPVAAVPYAPPNMGPQLAYPFAPSNGGLPYYIGGPQNQPGLFPPQQQVAAGQGPIGNNQAAGLIPPGSLTRFKVSFIMQFHSINPPSIIKYFHRF